MQFTSLFLGLLALPAVFASPIELEERATDKSAAVLQLLTQTGTDINKLNNTLNSFPNNGPIPGLTLISVKNQGNAITYDIGNNTNNIQSSSKFTTSESKAITAKVKSLEPSIFALLSNFIRHEPAFAGTSAGVKAQVLSSLQTQKNLTATQGKAFQAKLAQPYAGQAPGITKTIISHFNQAIAAYS